LPLAGAAAPHGTPLTYLSHPDKITMVEKQPRGFAVLEDFDGFEFVFDQGYYARIVFKRDERRIAPHPFLYSLTLHAADGTRLLGFDNAHPSHRKSGNAWRRSAIADHWHRDRADTGRTYAFESPTKLFRDFQREVERILAAIGIDPNPVQMRRSK
jgi:hypothetical protein